jgi:hypothetical protein
MRLQCSVSICQTRRLGNGQVLAYRVPLRNLRSVALTSPNINCSRLETDARHGIVIIECCGGALPGGEENWRRVLWGHLRRDKFAQQSTSRHQVCTSSKSLEKVHRLTYAYRNPGRAMHLSSEMNIGHIKFLSGAVSSSPSTENAHEF